MKDEMSREVLAALDQAGIGIASTTYEITGLPPLTGTRTLQDLGIHADRPAPHKRPGPGRTGSAAQRRCAVTRRGAWEGSIVKDPKNGRWRAMVDVGDTPAHG